MCSSRYFNQNSSSFFRIANNAKTEIKAAKKYAEGRGIRIDIKDQMLVADIEKLIAIKVAY